MDNGCEDCLPTRWKAISAVGAILSVGFGSAMFLSGFVTKADMAEHEAYPHHSSEERLHRLDVRLERIETMQELMLSRCGVALPAKGQE